MCFTILIPKRVISSFDFLVPARGLTDKIKTGRPKALLLFCAVDRNTLVDKRFPRLHCDTSKNKYYENCVANARKIGGRRRRPFTPVLTLDRVCAINCQRRQLGQGLRKKNMPVPSWTRIWQHKCAQIAELLFRWIDFESVASIIHSRSDFGPDFFSKAIRTVIKLNKN